MFIVFGVFGSYSIKVVAFLDFRRANCHVITCILVVLLRGLARAVIVILRIIIVLNDAA